MVDGKWAAQGSEGEQKGPTAARCSHGWTAWHAGHETSVRKMDRRASNWRIQLDWSVRMS
jgi:hypothetical protein